MLRRVHLNAFSNVGRKRVGGTRNLLLLCSDLGRRGRRARRLVHNGRDRFLRRLVVRVQCTRLDPVVVLRPDERAEHGDEA